MNIQKIREDFPVLQAGKPLIYFDNACQTLRPVQVIEKISEYYKEYPACGGRSVHRLGKRVTEEVQKSRQIVQKFIGAVRPEEIIFTRNTTEGINTVLNSIELNKNDAILTTDKEHNSMLLPVQVLAEKKGIKHEIVKSNPDNTFSIEKFKSKINRNTKIVCIVHTSNIDGVTSPAKEIIKIAHDNGSLVLLDGAQSVPHREINVKKLGADFLAFSGHKMCGPSGTGILYGRYELLEQMKPFVLGGETVSNTTYATREMENPPEKFEPGLQDYAGIAGLGAAIEYVKGIGLNNIEKHEMQLNRIITDSLSGMASLSVIGPKNPGLRSGIFSFNIKGLSSHDIAMILDHAKGIAIRSGMHCAHSWFNSRGIAGSARASLYFYNTEEECRSFADAVKEVAKLG